VRYDRLTLDGKEISSHSGFPVVSPASKDARMLNQGSSKKKKRLHIRAMAFHTPGLTGSRRKSRSHSMR
jgi:hypothetical protein